MTDETYGEWLRRLGPDSPEVTASERARLMWERARDAEHAEQIGAIEALVGCIVKLRRPMQTLLGAMDVRERLLHVGPHDRETRLTVPTTASFVIRARFGSRLLGIECGTGETMLLRPDWLLVVSVAERGSARQDEGVADDGEARKEGRR